MRHYAAIAVWLVSMSIAYPALAQQHYSGPIIDMHLHARTAPQAPRQLCFPAPCEGAPTQSRTGDEMRENTLAAMREHNVVLGLLSDNLDTVDQWRAAAPGLFVPAYPIGSPSDIDVEAMSDALQTGRIAAIGEIYVQYDSIAIDDPVLGPLFAFADERDLPVLIHNGGLGGVAGFPSHLGSPLHLVPVLQKYPGLRIYVENAGWPFLDDMVAVMYQYPSVYADVSTILHLTPRPVAQRYIRELMDAGLGHRIMFGSDQMSWPEVIDIAIETIDTADFLTPEQKAAIFYENAARFLRLSEEEIARHRMVASGGD